MLKREELYLIIFLFVLGLMVGIMIGYYISPFGIFECFKKFEYQNVTCFEDSSWPTLTYHCFIGNQTEGYLAELIKKK